MKRSKIILKVAALVLAAEVACGAQSSQSCSVVVLPANVTGGCRIRLVTPGVCEQIDLTGGRSYEFAWTTDTTYCETPYTLAISGNPATASNTKTWSLSTNVQQGISSIGGIVNVTANDLSGLTTDNGLYHWVVAGYYESHPDSRTFRIFGSSGGPADVTSPALTITSHSNNQTATTSSITVTGTATDSGRGDSGISSVTVNGVRATGDTATGSGTANWSRAVTLSQGANTITVVASDGSAGQNPTTQTITVTYSPTPAGGTSTTSNTYHVFPQYADGTLPDGRYFRAALMISNPSTSSVSCTFRLYGLTVGGQSTFQYTIPGTSWRIEASTSAQALRSGYAALQCSANVEAQLLYSFYAPNGTKISEATVFSSPPAGMVQILGDSREGARIGLAIANDSDQNVTYTLAAYNSSGAPIGTTSVPLAARTNRAAYLDDFFQVPANNFGQVIVSSSTGSASLIGLRFTGDVFTTIPSTNRSALGATAATYHVFPQIADGVLSDGTYFGSTLMIANPSGSSGATCTFQMYGLSIGGSSSYTYTLSPSAWLISPLSSTQSLRSGYATLSCSARVDAQLLYSFYSQSGGKLSEATVFSSPSAGTTQVLADGRENARLGLAVANDTDQQRNYTITAYTSLGVPVGTYVMPLSPRTSRAAFIDDLLPTIPAGNVGLVIVTGADGAGSIIGLRFTGVIFTTIPETIR